MRQLDSISCPVQMICDNRNHYHSPTEFMSSFSSNMKSCQSDHSISAYCFTDLPPFPFQSCPHLCLSVLGSLPQGLMFLNLLNILQMVRVTFQFQAISLRRKHQLAPPEFSVNHVTRTLIQKTSIDIVIFSTTAILKYNNLVGNIGKVEFVLLQYLRISLIAAVVQ